MFTAGNDIADFAVAAQSGEDMAALDFVRRIAGFSKPLVAAVEGLAIGIGCTLLLHCDLVYVAPDARFSLPFVDLGLLPEAGSSLLLPRRVGMARASAWLLLPRLFRPTRLGGGARQRHSPQCGPVGVRGKKAAALAAKPRAALLQARRFLRGDQDEITARIEADMWPSRRPRDAAGQAALKAFLNKSK